MPIPNTKNFFENVIDDFESIITFSHIKPDGDAYGSSMGMKLALEYLYPGKKCYCVGSFEEDIPSYLPRPTKPSELSLETIQNSLCIITDTGTTARLEDPRALQGKMVVKIDHHPLTEHFGDYEFVDDLKSSSSVIVADMLFASFPVIPSNSATALLLGMLTDTGYFRFSSDPDDFSKAGRLIYDGANIQDLYDILLLRHVKDLETKKQIIALMKTDGQVAYCVFPSEKLKELKISADKMSEFVNTIGFTVECPVWAFFCQYDDGSVRVELRSSRTYDVSQVAFKFNGGGHKHASGMILKGLDDVKKVLDALKKI